MRLEREMMKSIQKRILVGLMAASVCSPLCILPNSLPVIAAQQETKVSSESALLAALEQGGTITLTNNISLSQDTPMAYNNFVLNGNGYKIFHKVTSPAYEGDNGVAIQLGAEKCVFNNVDLENIRIETFGARRVEMNNCDVNDPYMGVFWMETTFDLILNNSSFIGTSIVNARYDGSIQAKNCTFTGVLPDWFEGGDLNIIDIWPDHLNEAKWTLDVNLTNCKAYESVNSADSNKKLIKTWEHTNVNLQDVSWNGTRLNSTNIQPRLRKENGSFNVRFRDGFGEGLRYTSSGKQPGEEGTEGNGSGSGTTNGAGGWKQTNGKWWYQNADGSYPSSTFKTIGGNTYYFDGAGFMKTGWLNRNGNWYFFNEEGYMKTGPYWDQSTGGNGTYYYLEPADGKMHTGWLERDGETYYYDQSGAQKFGWLTLNGKSYALVEDGRLARNAWVGFDYVGADGAWQPGKVHPQKAQIEKELHDMYWNYGDREKPLGGGLFLHALSAFMNSHQDLHWTDSLERQMYFEMIGLDPVTECVKYYRQAYGTASSAFADKETIILDAATNSRFTRAEAEKAYSVWVKQG